MSTGFEERVASWEMCASWCCRIRFSLPCVDHGAMTSGSPMHAVHTPRTRWCQRRVFCTMWSSTLGLRIVFHEQWGWEGAGRRLSKDISGGVSFFSNFRLHVSTCVRLRTEHSRILESFLFHNRLSTSKSYHRAAILLGAEGKRVTVCERQKLYDVSCRYIDLAN